MNAQRQQNRQDSDEPVWFVRRLGSHNDSDGVLFEGIEADCRRMVTVAKRRLHLTGGAVQLVKLTEYGETVVDVAGDDRAANDSDDLRQILVADELLEQVEALARELGRTPRTMLEIILSTPAQPKNYAGVIVAAATTTLRCACCPRGTCKSPFRWRGLTRCGCDPRQER